jgi:hypothetical protein
MCLNLPHCRDRTVKVWDFNNCSSGVCSGDSEEPSHNASIPAVAVNAISTGANQKPAYVLHTPTAVGRISWRPFDNSNGRAPRQQLQLATSSPDRGEVSVWDVNMPNIPVCILRGHSGETCTGIAWLDTPASCPVTPSVGGPDKSKGTRGSFLRRKEATPVTPPVKSESTYLGVYLCSGKDGQLLIQDLRNGIFPRQHIARSVTTISSRGHVAFQRGDVSRVRTYTTFYFSFVLFCSACHRLWSLLVVICFIDKLYFNCQLSFLPVLLLTITQSNLQRLLF